MKEKVQFDYCDKGAKENLINGYLELPEYILRHVVFS